MKKILNDLVQKIAQYRSSLDSDAREAEDQILTARSKIDAKRKDAKARLDEITRLSDEAQRELTAARDKYQGLRKELDRLLPELAEKFADGDKLIGEVELFLPSGQIRGLSAEIEEAALHFGFLDASEQKAQLMIWIGKLRRLQMTNASRPGEEVQQLESIFRRLVSLSKQYMPGYIDAFQGRAGTSTSPTPRNSAWPASRRRRDRGSGSSARSWRPATRPARTSRGAYYGHRGPPRVIATHKLPDDGLDEFNAVLARVVNDGTAGGPARLVRPFRELITGGDFRAPQAPRPDPGRRGQAR